MRTGMIIYKDSLRSIAHVSQGKSKVIENSRLQYISCNLLNTVLHKIKRFDVHHPPVKRYVMHCVLDFRSLYSLCTSLCIFEMVDMKWPTTVGQHLQ